MLSEFQCGACGAKFVVAFSMEPEPGKPLRSCVVCGAAQLTFLRSVDEKQLEEELKKEKGEVKSPGLDPQWGIRYCFEVGQEVLVRDGTRWTTSKIEKITVYRGQAGLHPPLCPQCAMPLLGEPRFWFKHWGNLPISEIMAKEDIDARLGPEPVGRIMVGKPVPSSTLGA